MGNYTRMKMQKKGEKKMTKAKTIFFFKKYTTPKTRLNQYMETQYNGLQFMIYDFLYEWHASL